MINRNYPNYRRGPELRPTPSSDRNMAPSGRYAMGRVPDESVYSYRARLRLADPKRHPDPGDPPAPRKRAWLTRAEWMARDARKAAESEAPS